MDVHRVRFIQQPSAAITCYAFSPSQSSKRPSSKTSPRLAVGRSDGSIEIWNPHSGDWIQETIFPPSGQDPIDSLIWTEDPTIDGIPGQFRLFSIGSSSNVAEWNLKTGLVKRRNTGNFGEVWCFAAQPKTHAAGQESDQAQDLVVGCGDGTIALLSTADDDLQFKRYLARVGGKKARCLSITYQKPNVVVAGFADGTMRVFDTYKGMMLRTMSLGAGLPGAPKTTLIWKVLTLTNGDIVSADSNGELRMWDGKLYSMTQRIKGHDGDCLDIVASADGKVLFSGGVDDRVATYRATTADRGRTSWAKLSHRRVRDGHGPVKALAAYDSPALSVFLTAGNDPSLTVFPLRGFSKEMPRTLPYSPHSSQVTGSSKARLVVSWWHSTISIYRFRSIQSEQSQQKSHQLVARIKLEAKHRIRSVSISTTGRLLAVSTSTDVKMFQLRPKSHQTPSLAVRKVEMPSTFARLGARLVAISPDESWLAAVTPDNEIHVARIDREVDKPKLVKVLAQTVELELPSRETLPSSLATYEQTITQLVFNSESAMLAVCDVAGNLSSWVLNGIRNLKAPPMGRPSRDPNGRTHRANVESSGEDDSEDDDDDDVLFNGQAWENNAAPSPPRLDSAASVLTFRPGRAHDLLAISARHQMYELDLKTGRLTDWSKLHPTSSMPKEFTDIRQRISGSMWDPLGRLWLHGQSVLVMLDLATLSRSENIAKTGKRKHDVQDGNSRRDKRSKRSGARGHSIPSSYNVAGPDTVTRTDANTALEIELDRGAEDELSEEDDLDFGIMIQAEDVLTNGHADERVNTTQRRQSWHTYKYRFILGIVPLCDVDQAGAETVEMVVVEQPH